MRHETGNKGIRSNQHTNVVTTLESYKHRPGNQTVLCYLWSQRATDRCVPTDQLPNRRLYTNVTQFFRAMLCISTASAVVRCLSVRPSVCLSCWVFVTFVYCVETSEHILKLFSLSCRFNMLVFPYQTLWQNFDWEPLIGASNAGGV